MKMGDDAHTGREGHEGRETMEKLEQADEVPTDPREWPDDESKYLTFGGAEGTSDDAYGEGPTEKLGPGNVQHQADGSVTVEGEKVDDPERFKGQPIPGGPTDPSSADA
jgi:hypothetical protein